jgi:hypothetical protein
MKNEKVVSAEYLYLLSLSSFLISYFHENSIHSPSIPHQPGAAH